MSFDCDPSDQTPPAHSVCGEVRVENPQMKDEGKHKDDKSDTKGKGMDNNSGSSEQLRFDLCGDLSNVSIQISCI